MSMLLYRLTPRPSLFAESQKKGLRGCSSAQEPSKLVEVRRVKCHLCCGKCMALWSSYNAPKRHPSQAMDGPGDLLQIGPSECFFK